jgi:hypothetical protein
MRLSSVRVLGISWGIGLILGGGGGLIFALAADRVITHGIGTGLLVVGLIALALGLLGATEPPDGWSLKKRRPDAGDAPRRSFAARAAYEHPALTDEVSSWSLALWGLLVGGGLIALSMLFFSLAV